MVTYDEAKRRLNIVKHSIDLADVWQVFNYPVYSWEDMRLPYGESRICTLGFLAGRVVKVVWTERESGIHAISCQHAVKSDVKLYFEKAV